MSVQKLNSKGLGILAVLAIAGSTGACATVSPDEMDASLASLRAEMQEEMAEGDRAVASELDGRVASVERRIADLESDLQQMERDFEASIQRLEDQLRFNVPVYFGFDDATVEAEDEELLDRFGSVAAEYYPNAMITVEGFTDPSGNEAYNLTLGQRRADAVAAYLHDEHRRSMHEIRVRAVSYGEDTSRLVMPADMGPGRRTGWQNRRVVLVIDHDGVPPMMTTDHLRGSPAPTEPGGRGLSGQRRPGLASQVTDEAVGVQRSADHSFVRPPSRSVQVPEADVDLQRRPRSEHPDVERHRDQVLSHPEAEAAAVAAVQVAEAAPRDPRNRPPRRGPWSTKAESTDVEGAARPRVKSLRRANAARRSRRPCSGPTKRFLSTPRTVFDPPRPSCCLNDVCTRIQVVDTGHPSARPPGSGTGARRRAGSRSDDVPTVGDRPAHVKFERRHRAPRRPTARAPRSTCHSSAPSRRSRVSYTSPAAHVVRPRGLAPRSTREARCAKKRVALVLSGTDRRWSRRCRRRRAHAGGGIPASGCWSVERGRSCASEPNR